MHSDNYELARSSAPQSIQDYSAFTDKQGAQSLIHLVVYINLKMLWLNLTSVAYI